MTEQTVRKLMCANRGEIAIRVFRAANELGIRTVAIFSHEDRVNLHRYKADEAYLVGRGSTPVGAYLQVDEIIQIARDSGVDAIHPGYGFLSERADFARACAEANIHFVGPSPDVIQTLGSKTRARALAIECGVPVVPGTEHAISSLEEARAFVAEHGLPVIVKASMGGGGRGMRVVREAGELEEALERCRSEAQAFFGDGSVFLERFLVDTRHIEVQLLGDATGAVIHLHERDCSVQRRHQKVVEVAPAQGLLDDVRQAMCAHAVALGEHVGYTNAGTVEFLLDAQGRHYFMEVNPRIQVEHTVTEEVTGIDLVQAQIRIAGGETLADLGLAQERIVVRGAAIQCRVTTEDPEADFRPDTGRLATYRSGGGMGIRLDGGAGYPGAVISPHYDSLLVKVTARGLTFEIAAQKLGRALAEFRIRGVKTNIPFLGNVLGNASFLKGQVHTRFVDQTPALFVYPRPRNRAMKLLRYLGDVVVNGHPSPLTSDAPPSNVDPVVPPAQHPPAASSSGWRGLLLEEGPAAFARAVRAEQGLLVMDTTWRDAHQSLLATRMRTVDMRAIAPHTNHQLARAYSLEMWGGATFDVCLRFLRECPWDRLDQLREQVPEIPFQMLLRGANAVGYTSYPDNVVFRFAKLAREHGIDVFRIFDSLNDLENLKVGIDAAGEAGGVVEASICYTGDVGDPSRTKYSLDYYLDLVGRLQHMGVHVLCVKDMAGLLKPRAATVLIEGLRAAFPDLPIHVHTHDTAGTGVASMLACAEAGADVVDLAMDAMAGLTAQPAMGAVVAALRGSPRDTGIDLQMLHETNEYWEQVRALYAPFESGLKSAGADVYEHEMPGGQYTNLKLQAQVLGLAGRWPAIKRAYSDANRLLGDLVKVTPSSKVVGDLAQFMVQNDLSASQVLEQAATLSLPSSLVSFFQGYLGQPHGGFPEPLRERVLKGEPTIEGRPGASLDAYDFEQHKAALEAKHGEPLRDVDELSAALYPRVFDAFMRFRQEFGEVSVLPTRSFLTGLEVGEEISFDLERGKTLIVKLIAVGDIDAEGRREVFYELNGQPRSIRVADKSAQDDVAARERADVDDPCSVGAPMPGVVVEVKVKQGQQVEAGEALVVLSAMKMEMAVAAPVTGTVQRVVVAEQDQLQAGDLIAVLTPGSASE